MLQQLIFDSESAALEAAYSRSGFRQGMTLSRDGVHQVLRAYALKWILGDDAEEVLKQGQDTTVISQYFQQWPQVIDFLQGQTKAYEYRRIAEVGKRKGGRTLTGRFSFDEVHEIVGGVTSSFGPFWETECQEMKDADGPLLLRRGARDR